MWVGKEEMLPLLTILSSTETHCVAVDEVVTRPAELLYTHRVDLKMKKIVIILRILIYCQLNLNNVKET